MEKNSPLKTVVNRDLDPTDMSGNAVIFSASLVMNLQEKSADSKSIEENIIALINQITAKTIAKLKCMKNPCDSLDMLGNCILLIFDKPAAKSFPWEQVVVIFSSPGAVIHHLRKSAELIKKKTLSEETIKELMGLLSQIKIQEVNSHRFSKELELFVNFTKEYCEVYTKLWPIPVNILEAPKRKFRIPQSAKKLEENQLLQQINKEKKNTPGDEV